MARPVELLFYVTGREGAIRRALERSGVDREGIRVSTDLSIARTVHFSVPEWPSDRFLKKLSKNLIQSGLGFCASGLQHVHVSVGTAESLVDGLKSLALFEEKRAVAQLLKFFEGNQRGCCRISPRKPMYGFSHEMNQS